MPDSRNPKEVYDVGKFLPFTHPQYGPGAVREVTYLDGTIERRFFYHGTADDPSTPADAGYLVGQPTVDPKIRALWDQGKPPERADAAPPKESDIRPSSGPKREVYRNGAWVVEDNPVYQPPASASQPQVVPTNTTEPFIVIRQPDGSLKTDPNPNYTGPTSKPGTNLHIESGGKHYIIPIDATGKAGAAQDLGLPAEAKPGSRSLVDGGDGQKYIVTIGADNTVTTTDTAGRPVPGGVPPKRDAGTIRYNPETGEYEQVRTDPATGRATVSAVPREGAGPAAPKSPAPLLPQIVVGQSQDALRTAYAQIQEEVDSGRRTAAWGENRRKEVFEAAQITVQEAQLVEQSRQANQTTSFNVSNTVLQYGQSALENALKFTLSINDKLKPGSGSGGRMFAALFNMQMKMAKDSGIYDIGVPRGSSVGGPRAPGAPGQPPGAPGAPPPAPPPRLTNVGDPAAVEADHQQSLAKLAAGDAADAAAAAAAPGGRAMTPSIGGPPQALPQPVPGGPAVPPPTAPPGAPPPVRDDWRTAPGASSVPPSTQPSGPSYVNPPAGQPGNVPSAPVGMAPSGQGFPALDVLRAQFAPQPVQLDPTGGTDQQAGGIQVPGLPPALMRAQIAATPPWRLPQDQLEDLVNQHGQETVFGWPGRNLLGAGY